jgi:hypothetical protein
MSDDGVIELQYQSSRRDVMRFYWRSLRRRPQHRRVWLALVLVAAALGGMASAGGGASFAGFAATAVLGALAMAVVLAIAPLVLFKPQMRTLVLKPQGIYTAINGKTKDYLWTDIQSVETFGDRIVIQCANQNAFIIPPEAFPSAAAREEGCRTIKKYLQNTAG